MKGRLVVLGRHEGREAAALVVDGKLEDLLIEDDGAFAPGAILRAVVDRQMKGQGGVFVRLPVATGFLKETGGLSPGDALLVQVSGRAEPGKAVPVTARIIFKNRLAILTPGAPGINVSRKIRDSDERARLETIAGAAMVMEGAGLILRSATEGGDADEISSEITELCAVAGMVMADKGGNPELLLDAPTPHEEAWRDWCDPAPDEVAEGETSFAIHGIDDMIAALRTPVVALGASGSMAIEPTRALVAVDVNTGNDTSPAAGLKVNIAAARDLARQLRLRGLGGKIVVDFAPMPKKDRVALEQQLRAAFRGEASETSLAGWTPLGNFELQRKRDRIPLLQLLS